MGNATGTGERLAYARCFVEIAAARSLPSQVTLEMEGESIDIPVEYEWTPPLCKKCVNFGHSETQCPIVPVWTAKEKVTQREAENEAGTAKENFKESTEKKSVNVQEDSRKATTNKDDPLIKDVCSADSSNESIHEFQLHEGDQVMEKSQTVRLLGFCLVLQEEIMIQENPIELE